MIKTINIGEKEVKLSNNIGWAMEYRGQFGHDIIPDLLPVISAVIALVKEAGTKPDFKKVDTEVIQDALINLAGLQFVDFINLIWALAKTADESIEEPRKWVKQFEKKRDPILPTAPRAWSPSPLPTMIVSTKL